MKSLVSATAALGLALGVAAPAYAQNVNANNLVNVNISEVANNLAEDLDVNVQDLLDLGSVQVPIGVAANVCNVAANVLAGDTSAEGAACDAETTSQALTQIVKREMNTASQ